MWPEDDLECGTPFEASAFADLPPLRVPRGPVEFKNARGEPVLEYTEEMPPAKDGELAYDRETERLLICHDGEWHPVKWELKPGSAGFPVPVADGDPPAYGPRLKTLTEGWAVRSDGVEICRITDVGADGIPPERIVMNGVEYDRVWSVTEQDWVYA